MIVIHGDDGLVFALGGIAENGVGDVGAGEVGEAEGVELLDGGGDGGGFFRAEGSVFTGVWIEAADGDFGRFDTLFSEKFCGEAANGDDAFLSELHRDLGERDMDGGEAHAEVGAGQEHSCFTCGELLGEEFCLAGVLEAKGLEAFFGDGAGYYGGGVRFAEAACGFAEGVVSGLGGGFGGLAGGAGGAVSEDGESESFRKIG